MGWKILRSRRSLAVVAGMKKTNDHAEPSKSNAKKKRKKKKRKRLEEMNLI